MLRTTLLLLLFVTPAFTADSCSSAKQDLEKFLDTLSTSCTADSDCTGRYFGADACAPPVVTNKEKFTDNHQLFLLQKSVRVSCGTQDKPRPVCSPIPYRATCKQNKCVDTLKETIALLPKSPYRSGTINHSCGPADGPAMAISLTQTQDTKKGPWLNIYINEHLPEIPLSSPKSYDLKIGADAGASRCIAVGDCSRADSGTVTLHRLDGTSGSGHYQMHFPDGTTEEGDFELRWIEVRMMCG